MRRRGDMEAERLIERLKQTVLRLTKERNALRDENQRLRATIRSRELRRHVG